MSAIGLHGNDSIILPLCSNYWSNKKRNKFKEIYSRYILAHVVFEDAKMENVINVLQAVVAAYGLPKEILTDCGAQFHTCKGMNGSY